LGGLGNAWGLPGMIIGRKLTFLYIWLVAFWFCMFTFLLVFQTILNFSAFHSDFFGSFGFGGLGGFGFV
jgi:hypothetical protein